MPRRLVIAITLLITLAGTASAHADKDVAMIRRERANSNAAIAKHNFAAIAQTLLPDYTILPGSNGSPFDVAGYNQRLGRDLADPTFVTYVRTPDRISVADSRKRAAENGHWEGIFHEPDGVMRLGGIYQATWMLTAAGWRLKNESYITLRCIGSQVCADRN